MTINIVRLGKLQSKREWIGTCSKCETIVEYLQEDATSSGDCQRDGFWTKLKCPLDGCNNEIYGSPKPPQSR